MSAERSWRDMRPLAAVAVEAASEGPDAAARLADRIAARDVPPRHTQADAAGTGEP